MNDSHGSRPVILCVDDEAPVLASLQRLFRDEPYEIITATRPEEALNVIKRREVHVLIADQRMPGMKGTDLLKAARGASPKTKRMILTAYADFDAMLEAINDVGVHQFLMKPWDDEGLKNSVRSLLLERRRSDDPVGGTGASNPGTSPRNPLSSDPLEFRVDCAGKRIDEVLSEIRRVPSALRSSEDEVWILMEDLMSLDDSVTTLLSQVVRTIFKAGTRVSLHLKLKRGHFGS